MSWSEQGPDEEWLWQVAAHSNNKMVVARENAVYEIRVEEVRKIE